MIPSPSSFFFEIFKKSGKRLAIRGGMVYNDTEIQRKEEVAWSFVKTAIFPKE